MIPDSSSPDCVATSVNVPFPLFRKRKLGLYSLSQNMSGRVWLRMGPTTTPRPPTAHSRSSTITKSNVQSLLPFQPISLCRHSAVSADTHTACLQSHYREREHMWLQHLHGPVCTDLTPLLQNLAVLNHYGFECLNQGSPVLSKKDWCGRMMCFCLFLEKSLQFKQLISVFQQLLSCSIWGVLLLGWKEILQPHWPLVVILWWSLV